MDKKDHGKPLRLKCVQCKQDGTKVLLADIQSARTHKLAFGLMHNLYEVSNDKVIGFLDLRSVRPEYSRNPSTEFICRWLLEFTDNACGRKFTSKRGLNSHIYSAHLKKL